MQEFTDRWEMTPEEHKNLVLKITSTSVQDWMFEETPDKKDHYIYYRGKQLIIKPLYDLGLLNYSRLESID